jgi:hypothetical protein
MNTSVTIDQHNYPVIHCRGLCVVTTEMLAQLYGTESARIRKNHSRQKDRFSEGKHFFKLEGDELSSFKETCPFVEKNTRSLMLWTERGAVYHAKMLQTETAWEMFEKLEDVYFGDATRPAIVAVANRHPGKLMVGNLQIREDDGNRFCLNDIWQVAGNHTRQRPSEFLGNWRGMEFAAQLEREHGTPSVSGMLLGTKEVVFARIELAIAYAMWIRPSLGWLVVAALGGLKDTQGLIQHKRPQLNLIAGKGEPSDKALKPF